MTTRVTNNLDMNDGATEKLCNRISFCLSKIMDEADFSKEIPSSFKVKNQTTKNGRKI